MQLTNKTHKKFFWREAGNRFFIEVDGKPLELKFSLHQNEKYKEFIKKEKIENDEKIAVSDVSELVIKRLESSVDNSAEIVELALNPKHDEIAFTREQVLELFEEQIDLMKIVAKTYVDKKIFNPTLDSLLDPHLASGA